MVGIGVVTYNEVVDKNKEITDIFSVVIDLITSISLFTTEPYILIIVDNGSLDHRFTFLNVILKKKFPHINSVFIRNSVNDLTNAWNMITEMCINTYMCDSVILLNQDIILTKYWMPFVLATTYQRKDVIAPMSNGVCYQPLQLIDDNDFIPEDKILVCNTVQGFCFGASRQCLASNKYNSGHYFDPNISWDYNEEEFQQRNNANGGKSLIVKNSFVVHLEQCSWMYAGFRSTKKLPKIYSGEERELVLDKFKYSAYYNCK